MNHAETAPDFPNGVAPGRRAIGVISAVLIALRLISLEAGKTPAEVWC